MARANLPRLGGGGVPREFCPGAAAPGESGGDVDMDKISSKVRKWQKIVYSKTNFVAILLQFGWDHKSITWEILNMSVAVGPGHPDGNDLDANLESDPDPGDPIEYACLLDIDYMTSLPFQAGHHEQNKSTW